MGKGIVKLGEGNWAVKDGNLLAAKETNGRFKNAEFTVARGSDATYVGRDGLIKTTPSFYNLINYSEDFSQWSGLIALSIGLNQGISPNGSTEASLFSIGIDSSSTRHRLYNLFNFVLGDTYTYSIFAKKNENDWFQLMFSTSAFDAESYANFDLNNGVVGDKGTSTTANITYYGNGWYRCSITCTASASVTTTYEILTTNNTNSGRYPSYQSSAAVNVCFLWGAQLVEGAEALDYQYTNGKEGIPRIDFTDNTDGHLLLEPQSRNIITYSEDFSEWSGNEVTIQTGFLAPDGSNNARKITSTGSQSYLALSGLGLTGTDTRTIYAKTVSGTGTVNLCSYGQNTNNNFTITEDWQRFEVNGTTTTTGQANFYAVDFRFQESNPLSEVIVWGAQAEALSYATSYMPTDGSTVTRDAETCTGAGEAIDFNSSEGVLYAEIARTTAHNDYELLSISPTNNSDGTHYASLGYNNTDNKLWIRAKIGNTVAIASIGEVDTILNQFYKIAIKYKSGENAIYVDGEKLINTDITDGSEATTFTPTQNTISDLEFRHWDANNSFHGKVKAIRVYKDASIDLATLTS